MSKSAIFSMIELKGVLYRCLSLVNRFLLLYLHVKSTTEYLSANSAGKCKCSDIRDFKPGSSNSIGT